MAASKLSGCMLFQRLLLVAGASFWGLCLIVGSGCRSNDAVSVQTLYHLEGHAYLAGIEMYTDEQAPDVTIEVGETLLAVTPGKDDLSEDVIPYVTHFLVEDGQYVHFQQVDGNLMNGSSITGLKAGRIKVAYRNVTNSLIFEEGRYGDIGANNMHADSDWDLGGNVGCLPEGYIEPANWFWLTVVEPDDR